MLCWCKVVELPLGAVDLKMAGMGPRLIPHEISGIISHGQYKQRHKGLVRVQKQNASRSKDC
jgi:hypothetical protein